MPTELQEDAEEAIRLAKERQREVVSDESGRTLTVTLHEVRPILHSLDGEHTYSHLRSERKEQGLSRCSPPRR